MDRETVIAALREHEPEPKLKAAGVVGLSVFGSVARGDSRDDSDVDVVVRLSEEAGRGGFAYFGRLAALERRLADILGRPVDVVAEPVRKDRLRRDIEREGAFVF
jgi:predicted nucleotidyltransferase